MVPATADIFVVGGGPSGLAAAIAARQRGFDVLVADGAQPPIDKACGEGFLPDGVVALRSLGVHVPTGDARSFRGIRFLSAHLSAEAAFADSSYGLAIRRTRLHDALVERAEQLGVTLLWATPVTGISRDGVQIGGSLVRARWIVGADGARSRVRMWAGLNRGPKPRLRYAFRQHFAVVPWADHMEVYWGYRCQGYATAVNGEQVCVALASHDPSLRLEQGLQELPALYARLRSAEVVSSERGALTGNRQLTHVFCGNVVLIGDASGTVDAITGEGMGLAFCQAIELADCLQSGELERYEHEHRKLALRPTWMARLMLTLDRRPKLQWRTLRVFQKHPEVFRRLVEFHVGTLPPLDLVRHGLTLGWGLLSTST